MQATKPPEPVVDRRILPDVWLPAAVLAALLATGLLGWWWTQLRPPKIRQKIFCDPALPGQYFDDASVGGAMPPWLAEADADHLADLLKYVLTEQYTRELDITASIQATSESGSVPVLRFRKRRDLQKILILTDQITQQQGWHQLPTELAQALQARGVHLTLGRFNYSPERFIDQHGRVQHLEDWEEYRHHLLLLIFADTHQAEGLQDFPWRDWPDVRLLTRQERRNWDFREQGLQAQGVRLLQADSDGIQQAWGEQPRSRAALEAARWEVEGQKPGEQDSDFLQRILGAALPWAQALAHYPGAWSLAAAEQLRNSLFPDVPRLALQRLLGLPGTWGTAGVAAFAPRIQVALRLGFIESSREQQAVVIRSWQGMMATVEPPASSLAWAIWRWKCIRLEWPLNPDTAAQAMHTLVVSAPALGDAIREEIGQNAGDSLATLLPVPQTRKGQRHLLEVGDACGLKKVEVYAPARRYRNAGMASALVLLVSVGIGVWNQRETPPSPPFAKGGESEVPVPHLVTIPGGTFDMGCVENKDCEDDEKPVHTVTVLAFEMGAYEVTNAQYVAFLNAVGQRGTQEQPWFETKSEDDTSRIVDDGGKYRVESGYDDHPAINISWYGAKAYLDWLSKQTKQAWRLPTEAEWEYATRGGTKTAYSWGDKLPVCDTQAANGAQFYDCKEKAPLKVGSFESNPLGLYDVHGNTLEWVEDCWQGDYKDAPIDGSARQGCDAGASRVLRGGSWDFGPLRLRSAYRDFPPPVYRDGVVGFRAARTINPLPFTEGGTQAPLAQAPQGGQAVQVALPATVTDIQKVPAPMMVQIPAGKFTMGCDPKRDDVEGGCSDDEKPAHEVNVPTFWLSETEVTVGQYMACVKAGACPEPAWKAKDAPSYYTGMGEALTGDNYPIVGVSWQNAQAYVQWLSKQTGKQYRLPTESEWEYAARAGTDTAYSWGNNIGKNNANCYEDNCGDKFDYTSPVGSFAKSPFGLSDMQGNVWEWVEDCWPSDYKDAPIDGTARQGCDANASRVLRGGSWGNRPQWLRFADRNNFTPVNRLFNVGFRAARTN